MRIFNLLSTLSAIALLVAGLSSPAKADDTIKIGIDASYRPFAFVDPSGELSGFEVELAKALCSKIKADCDISNVPWDGIWTALDAGSIDVIGTTVTKTPARLEKYDASSTIYKVGYGFIVPSTADISGGNESLKGKPIGTSVGTQNYYNYIRDTLGADTDIRGYDSPDAGVLDLDAGRIAAYQGDSLQLQGQFVSSGRYKFVDKIDNSSKWLGDGRALFVRKGSPDLVAKINTGLAELSADGTIEKLGQKYFAMKLAK